MAKKFLNGAVCSQKNFQPEGDGRRGESEKQDESAQAEFKKYLKEMHTAWKLPTRSRRRAELMDSSMLLHQPARSCPSNTSLPALLPSSSLFSHH